MAQSPAPPGTPGEPPPALLLDRYRVEATLGTGGFGTVVRAFDTRLKVLRAIKTLNPGLSVLYPDAFTQRWRWSCGRDPRPAPCRSP